MQHFKGLHVSKKSHSLVLDVYEKPAKFPDAPLLRPSEVEHFSILMSNLDLLDKKAADKWGENAGGVRSMISGPFEKQTNWKLAAGSWQLREV